MSNTVGYSYLLRRLLFARSQGNAKKAAKLADAIEGQVSGKIEVGSRTPIRSMPPWVTPEVTRGGFATGRPAAGWDIQRHEQDLAVRAGLPENLEPDDLRAALNEWFASGDGRALLHEMLRAQTYRADTPEENALLVIALISQEDEEEAQRILSIIRPFFRALRFFPRPAETPFTRGARFHTVEELRGYIDWQFSFDEAGSVSEKVRYTFTPLHDRLIDLLESRESSGWSSQARDFLTDVEAIDFRWQPRRWRDPEEPFQRGVKMIATLLQGDSLTSRDAKYAEVMVRRHRAKWGDPENRARRRAELREADKTINAFQLRQIIDARLAALPQDRGVEDVDSLSIPVTESEALPRVPAGTPVPNAFAALLRQAQEGTLPELLGSGAVPSATRLAQLSYWHYAGLVEAAFPDPLAGALFFSLYRAFRTRRSVLLLNYASQVRFEEVPWVAPIMARADANKVAACERKALTDLVDFALSHFPGAPFDNRLLTELRHLAKRCGEDIPIAKSIAGDIFMGDFAPSFHPPIQKTLAHYRGTLYERYFDLPKDVPVNGMGGICNARAQAAIGRQESSNASGVAWSGAVMEQMQVLTAENLGAILEAVDTAKFDFEGMARRCFESMLQRMRHPRNSHKGELRLLKEVARKWRLMIAYLSELSPGNQNRLLAEFQGELAQFPQVQARLAPAMTGLLNVIAGEPLGRDGGRLLLGWSIGTHPFQRPETG